MSSSLHRGKVFLVGAGPGDPALITLKAIECLRHATVVCYDYLVNEELLCYAPGDAERIYVGKKGAEKTFTQEKINKLLYEKADAGEVVVRLKGGDSMLFSRGGEEALYLAERGILFEIVPGVTSAIAAPTYAGIPITHRNISSSVHIFTAHLKDTDGHSLSLDWNAIVRLEGTLIFLMGYANLSTLSHELIKHGKPPTTPVAVIQWASLPEQRTLISTLDKVDMRAEREKFTPPVVIVMGECVNLREKLNWVNYLPLFGKRILVTRPTLQSEEFGAELSKFGAVPLIAPVIDIVPIEDNKPLEEALENIKSFHWLLFASANSVDIFMNELYAHGKDIRAISHLRIGTIGTKTAHALKTGWNIQADFTPTEFVQEELAVQLPIAAKEKVLIPRASTARDALPIILRQKGVDVEVLPTYEIAPSREGIRAAKTALRERKVDVATFTASSIVKFLLGNLKPEERAEIFKNVCVLSIGPMTSKTIREYGVNVDVEARHYTTESMLEELLHYFSRYGKS